MASSTAEKVRKVIKIAAIQQKKTAKGKDMWTITDDKDDFYSVFDEFVRGRLEVDQTVAVMVEINATGGKSYKNIVGIADALLSPATDSDVSELLPTSSMDIQAAGDEPAAKPNPDASAGPKLPPAPQTPEPLMTRWPTENPPKKPDMVDIRAKALGCAVRLCAGGVITHKQIEHNSNVFVKYILGVEPSEQNSSSEGEAVDEYTA